nr:ectoine utilization protein EutA [Chelativorans sp.]
MPVRIERSNVPLTFDERPLEKRIGLIILATDHTTEPDFRRMVASERIGVYVSRVPYANPVTPENLKRMQPALTQAAQLILPDEALDAVMYSCTSASVVIGDEEIARAIRAAKPGAPVVTPPLAAVHGLKALGIRRISVLTPYTEETSAPMAEYFAGHGFAIESFTCLGLDDDREMARISPGALVEAAHRATAPAAEALFISCTGLRSAGVAAEIETAIGRPVVTSNLATAWACLRLCGDATARPELGRLMTIAGYPG